MERIRGVSSIRGSAEREREREKRMRDLIVDPLP